MNPERRGLVLVVAVLLVSAVLGGIYGPSVRATTSSTDDYQTAVREFTRVLDVVQSNYAEQVDVDKAVYQKCKLPRIKEIRMRVEYPQHARDCALINRFVNVNLLGVVGLHHVQDARELPHGRLIIVGRGGCSPHGRAVNAPKDSRYQQNGNHKNQPAAFGIHPNLTRPLDRSV